MLAAAVTAAALTGAGCGGSTASGQSGSCTTVDTVTIGDAGVSDSLQSCLEGAGSAQIVDIVRQGCTSQAGDGGGGFQETVAFMNGPCPRANAVGGCRSAVTAGVSLTLWSYNLDGQNQTAADIMASCATNNATFVAP